MAEESRRAVCRVRVAVAGVYYFVKRVSISCCEVMASVVLKRFSLYFLKAKVRIFDWRP